MPIDEGLQRELGREAVRFCRRCPGVTGTMQGEYVAYTCHNTQCRLWPFLIHLGLRPGADFDAPTAEEALSEAHAREVRRFRGVLPALPAEHDWEADARFHGLFPGREAQGGGGWSPRGGGRRAAPAARGDRGRGQG